MAQGVLVCEASKPERPVGIHGSESAAKGEGSAEVHLSYVDTPPASTSREANGSTGIKAQTKRDGKNIAELGRDIKGHHTNHYAKVAKIPTKNLST